MTKNQFIKSVVICVVFTLILGCKDKKITIDMGIAEIKQGNTAKALEIFEKLARNGKDSAQSCLGDMYMMGIGVEQNDTKAMEWYTLAANQGMPHAQGMLAKGYELGRGVNKSLKLSAEWYEKAAINDHVSSQFNIGVMYKNGRGVEINIEKAAHWFKTAADNGDKTAQSVIGQYYLQGKGVEIDYKKSYEYFFKASKQGDLESYNYLAEFYYYGLGKEHSIDTAQQYYYEAINKINKSGNHNEKIIEKTDLLAAIGGELHDFQISVSIAGAGSYWSSHKHEDYIRDYNMFEEYQKKQQHGSKTKLNLIEMAQTCEYINKNIFRVMHILYWYSFPKEKFSLIVLWKSDEAVYVPLLESM